MSKWTVEQCYHEAIYVPRYYEVDNKRKLLIPCLLRYMQETAIRQIIKVGLSYWDLQELNVTWIFRRGQLKVNSLPVLGQEVKCISYASSVEKYVTHRDYKLFDDKDNLLASMTSEWILLNFEKNKLSPIEDVVGELPVRKADDNLTFIPFKIKKMGLIIHREEYRVRPFNLDFNGHANNACYSEWIMESLPKKYKNKELRNYNIQFKKECLLDDNLIVEHSAIESDHLQHSILDKSTGTIICLAESWY